jgi:DNA polymerase-3 subunit epsilon
MANLVIEAIQSVVPLRRCSARLGANHTPVPDATPCSSAQLGVSQCPCAGAADRTTYDAAVDMAMRAFSGDPEPIVRRLTGRMADLAATQRYEEAALVRDRLQALLAAIRRQQLVSALMAGDRCVVRRGGVSWVVDQGRLVDVSISGEVGRALPVDPPEPPAHGRPVHRHHVDEALCLAKYFDKQGSRLEVVSCTGTWGFPLTDLPTMPRLDDQSIGGGAAPVSVPSAPPSPTPASSPMSSPSFAPSGPSPIATAPS